MSKMSRWIMDQQQSMEMRENGHELSDRQQLDLAYYEYCVYGYRSGWPYANEDTLRGNQEAKRSSLDPLI